MKLSNIKESGANNILMWAITNGADVKSDPALQSVISDELSYLVTIEDVNFFELFRLTQMYRDKIRIIEEKRAEMPTRSELHKLFPGSYNPEPEDPTKEVQLCEIVEHCGESFINLAMQMTNDDHIITSGAVRLFLPMISRKFIIQLPVEFMDFINSMSEDEAARVYTTEYPGTLEDIIETENHGVKTTLQLALVRGTSIIKYDKQYEQYIKLLKYSPLKSKETNKLYKLALLGFFKYDNISRGEVRIDLFNSNKEVIASTLKRMARINNPLELEFAIQLPIQYMQILENSFSREVLTIAYESSMSNIIDGGLTYNDFITSEYNENSEDEEEKVKAEAHNNSIETYRVRIAEANQKMLNAMPLLLNSEHDVDITSVFAMMPSIYTTRAVIRINLDQADKLLKHHDPIITDMFNEAIDISNSILSDINKAK